LQLDLKLRSGREPRGARLDQPARLWEPLERASRLPPSAAAAAGDDAAPAGARIRRVAGASHGPRRERRLLGSKRHHRSRRPLQGHPGLPDRRMVRLMGGEHRCELRRAESTPQESGPSHKSPRARSRYTSYYLQPGGGVALQPPAAERSETSFVFAPHDPVPTIGGNISSGDGILLQGGWDQRGGDAVWNWPRPVPLSARADVVVFQTPPLETDVEVTGPITVKLWASSNRRDTDFTAKLIDVHPPSPDYPQGFDLNLGDGIIRARFRDSLARERLMQPGTVYEFTIKLYPTSNVF